MYGCIWTPMEHLIYPRSLTESKVLSDAKAGPAKNAKSNRVGIAIAADDLIAFTESRLVMSTASRTLKGAVRRMRTSLRMGGGAALVLSDQCELVSTRTVKLSLMPRRDRATHRERRHG